MSGLTFEVQKYLQPFLVMTLKEEIDFREDVDRLDDEQTHLHEDLAAIQTHVLEDEVERRDHLEWAHQPQGLTEWMVDGVKNSEIMKGYDWEGEEKKRIEAIKKRMREVALKLRDIPNQLICDELNIRRRTPMKRPTPGTEEYETEDLEREWERRKQTKAALSVDPLLLAEMFHEEYERLAPHMSYQTRKDSRVPWDDVPEPNRSLMVATCRSVLLRIAGEEPLRLEDLTNASQVP